MRKNLLLGNGINAHLGIEGLGVEDIAKRFADTLIRFNPFFDLMFGVNFSKEVCEELFFKTDKRGIESISATVYDYLVNKTKQICLNDRMRILDSIICCAITAIFYEGNEKLGSDWKREMLPDFLRYEQIYTLNYVEFWDDKDICIYLHGKYDIDSVKVTNKDVFHYSMERNRGYKGYNEIVRKLETDFNMQELYTRDIVFSPEFHRKAEMISMGSYPSENLYPADDLFLHSLKSLYSELNSVEEIEIFGMSPYGDDDIINRLNKMRKVTVYVYNCKSNRETQEWNRILTCDHEIKDSMLIME